MPIPSIIDETSEVANGKDRTHFVTLAIMPSPPCSSVQSGHSDSASQSSGSSGSGGECCTLGDFDLVLRAVSLDYLPELAWEVKLRETGEVGDLPEIGEPKNGSYNALFPIHFPCGTKWMAKFPINGVEGHWDEEAAEAWENEVLTMRFIQRETSIPVPDVFDYSTELDNRFGAPYIIMSLIEGIPLDDLWQGASEETRKRALTELAAAMAQLSKPGLQFDTYGCLLFDSDNNPVGFGPVRRINRNEEFRMAVRGEAIRMPPYQREGPFDDWDLYWFGTGQEATDSDSNSVCSKGDFEDTAESTSGSEADEGRESDGASDDDERCLPGR